MPTRRREVLAVAAALLAFALPATAHAATLGPPAPPATATQPADPGQDSYADPMDELGARSPICGQRLSGTAARNCAATGSPSQRYPLSSYGFDVQTEFSITHLQRSFLGALQSIAALVWMALIYLLKGVLLLLEWAFSIDLLGVAMGDARRALATLHNEVIGEPWFLAALSVAALWGIWRGLVQGQATRTLTGLAATVGLMVGGLVVLAAPEATVGHASRLANEAALGTLSAATTRDVDRPADSLSDAMIGVFDTLVRQPWCALEFGSVVYCDKHPPGRRDITNADVWLRYPTGSDERKSLYDLLKGKDPDDHSTLHNLTHPILTTVGIVGDDRKPLPAEVKRLVTKDKPRAAMQEAGATVPRFALLAVIGVGMLGAIALLGYLGLRLLLASVMALLLLLFAPAVLLAPAFGETGRATFLGWAKRLAGALVAKLVYALFLAVVLVAAAALARVQVGWFGTWLLQSAFWWGVLLKRHELVGLVPASNTMAASGGGHLLSRAYYAMAVGKAVRHTARRATAGPRRAGRAVGTWQADRREARSTAATQLADERLNDHAHEALTRDYDTALTKRDDRSQLRRELRAVDRRLIDYDEQHALSRAQNMPAPLATRDQRALLARRAELQTKLASPDTRADELRVLQAQRNIARIGDPVDPRDVGAYRTRRARDLRADLPPDHEQHLRAAGIDPARYAAAAEDEREGFRRQAEQHLERERDLVDGSELRSVQRHLDRAELRERTAVEHARLRQERRRRRTRTSAPPR